MEFDDPLFAVIIVALTMFAWVVTTAIRARHGYPLENDEGKLVFPAKSAPDETTKALAAENEQLKANVRRLEERLGVLERIATDPSRRLAEDIEKLR